MKIDDIIKKCIEIPGVSINRCEHSTELLLKQHDGKGSMTFFSLFPGITLAYIFVNAPTWPAPNLINESSNSKAPLLMNYCITGRCEIILNNGNFVYLKDNDFSLTENFAQTQYVYPRRIYEGLEFFIDIETVLCQSTVIKQVFEIDISQFQSIYSQNEKTYIAEATTEIKDTLNILWRLYDDEPTRAITQMRAISLSLFGMLLQTTNIPHKQEYTYLTKTQVEIAKRTEQIITQDLRQHHPAWELSEYFSISETSLKNYFRGVYGQNISVYLRELRMNKAALLLENTQKVVSEIAEQVGYINQSKFASVFKRQFGETPLEYRRTKKLQKTL